MAIALDISMAMHVAKVSTLLWIGWCLYLGKYQNLVWGIPSGCALGNFLDLMRCSCWYFPVLPSSRPGTDSVHTNAKQYIKANGAAHTRDSRPPQGATIIIPTQRPALALHCAVLHCTVLHCTVLHCTLWCTALCCTALQYAVLHCTVLHCNMLYWVCT